MFTARIAPLVIALCLGGGTSAFAADGASLAAACTSCHGSPVGAIPSLAGLPAEAIATALGEFRADARAGTIMNRIAKGYTPEELQAIADYLATQGAPQ